MSDPTTSLVQFTPLASVASPSFWHALTSLKIDVLKLSDAPLPMATTYGVGRTVRDRESGNDVAMGCTIQVGEGAFDAVRSGEVAVTEGGVIKREGAEGEKKGGSALVCMQRLSENLNRIEESNAADNADFADKMWKVVIEMCSTAALIQLLLVTHTDLKKYKYCYWPAFPRFSPNPGPVEGSRRSSRAW